MGSRTRARRMREGKGTLRKRYCRPRFTRPPHPPVILRRRRAVKRLRQTRYSRSVLINRLFMFNTAWYFSIRKFSKLSDRKRRDGESVGEERGNFEQGNAFASRRRLKPVKKKKVKRSCGIESSRLDRSHTVCLEKTLFSARGILRHLRGKTFIENTPPIRDIFRS